MADHPSDLISAGSRARSEQRLDVALAAFAQAVLLCRASADDSLLAKALTGMGQIERDLKHSEKSLNHYGEVVAIYRRLGEPQRLAHAIRHVADILRNESRHEEAKQRYAEALDIYRKHPDTTSLDLANAIRGLALTERELGDAFAAGQLWQEARTLYDSVGVQAGVEESERQLRDLMGK